MIRSEKGRERRKQKSSISKKKKISQELMKKAWAESVTLKRELHGLFKAQGSVLSKC